MDLKNNNTKMTKRKIIGLISLIVFSLVFIFSCLKKVLPVGAWLVGTFGGLVYPMSIVFAFISLAIFLGFSYSRNPKPIALFTLALLSILLTIHSIDTYKNLNDVVRFSQLKNYLDISYSNTTIVGSFGSIFGGLISVFLGGMGTIVTYVILATIFSGLLLDYELYGKYHEPHVKKLKSRKLREKVTNSDKNVSGEGVPNYSFESSQTNAVADEVSVDAREYETNIANYSNTISNYGRSETIDEITSSENYDGYNTGYEFTTGYNSFNSTSSDEEQSVNTFTNDFYKSDNIPDVYSSDMNDERRQFMSATFGAQTSSQFSSAGDEGGYLQGGYGETTPKNEQPLSFSSLNEEDDDYSIINQVNLGGFPSNETASDEPSLDDDILNILKTPDEEIESEVARDISENTFKLNDFNDREFSYGQNNHFASGISRPNETHAQRENVSNSHNDSGLYNNNNRYGSGFNPEISAGPYWQEQENKQSSNRLNNQPNVVIPMKEIKTPRSSSNVGMPGVRYNAPTLSLLKTPVPDTGDYTAEQNRKTMILENSLDAFKIPAKVKNIVRGPKITRYELSVPLGISVKKIPMYENDIAAALAAKTITIKAPIPGSNYVGIELENDTFTTVYQRELFESDAFQNCKDPLPIAIGKDISGEIVVKSLVDMVHLLIAGSTGSGKSVFIHNVVLSLIYKSSPDDLRLIMIDPKKVEFPVYNGLPHLLTPEVVAGSQKAINALKWCVREMDRRYDLMAKAGFNNIKPYNKSDIVKAGQFEKLPYIVIIVDELAEIMQANKKDAEACIQRITQLARACGMHMVLATQRPSVDIITGVIKNNIPSRIAFSLQSGIDSKTIINTVGAEKLLGRGDMIFYPTGTSAMPRLQASYASDEEIRAVIEYTIKNNEANYDEAVEKAMEQDQSEPDSVGGFNGGDGVPPQKDISDPYFKTAVKIVMQNGGASTSYLQRRLSIGYSRAARIMDQMGDKGYIAPSNGSKTRKILITPEQYKEEFGEDFDTVD